MIAITGATSGIGYEISKQYCENNKNVLLIGRNETKLSEQRDYLMDEFGVKVEYICADLSDKDQVNGIFETIKLEDYAVNTFINCAGFGEYGSFIDTDLDKEIEMIDVNVIALTALTKAAIVYYRENRIRGKVLNICSVAGHVPIPHMAVYGATKSYVKSFSQAINQELSDSKLPIFVSCMFPPAVETKFIADANAENSKAFQKKLLSPEKVAKIATHGLSKRKENIYCRRTDKIGLYLINILPISYRLKIINKKLGRK